MLFVIETVVKGMKDGLKVEPKQLKKMVRILEETKKGASDSDIIKASKLQIYIHHVLMGLKDSGEE